MKDPDDDELRFDAGDVIEITAHTNEDGWWWGRCDGREGLVPTNYIEKL